MLARVGDKWSMFIVMLLGDGPVRFNELKRRVDGISQRMLSLTLRNLERDGLVSRTVTPSVPVRVDYALTDLGRSLAFRCASSGCGRRTTTPPLRRRASARAADLGGFGVAAEHSAPCALSSVARPRAGSGCRP